MVLQFKNRELLGLKIHTEVVVKPLELPAPQLSVHHLSPSPPQHQQSLRIIAPWGSVAGSPSASPPSSEARFSQRKQVQKKL